MATRTRKRKMGRPPLPASKKRLPSVGFRPTPEIRKKLAKAADSSDRSMSHEIESRLERSFQDEQNKYDEFGGVSLYWLMKSVAAAGRMALDRSGGDFDDPVVGVRVFEMMELLLRDFKKKAALGRSTESGKVQTAKELLEVFEKIQSDEGFTNQTQKKTAKKTVKKAGK